VIKISADEKITLIQAASEDQDSYAFDIRLMNSDVYVNYGDRLDIIKSNGDIQSYSESAGVNFSNNSINDFYLLDGKLYIATWGGGVVVVSGDKSTTISYFDGMDVLTLTPIKSGVLASMADGIFLIKNDGSIEASGYLKIGSDKKQVFKSSHFSDGKIYLLYSNGLYEQKIFSINENNAINTPLFTGLKIKNKDVTKQVDAYGGESIFTTKKIDLHYYDSPVSIEFNAIGDGRDISYQYKMSDVDGDWVSSESNNIATYTNIPSGEHSFLVKSLYNGKELARSSVMVFVTPPLWLSTQAFVFYGLAFIGIAWLPISNIINKEKHRVELEKSENRLKTALWGSSDLLWDLDVKTNMLYFSSEHHEFNFPNDTIRYSELTGSTIHHADIDMVRSELGKHLRSETDEYNISYRIAGDSDYLWVHDKGKVVSRDASGAALRFSGTIRDISIEKAKENEFLLMAKSMENINDAIWIASDDFKIVQANNAFSKIMGFSDDALIGSVIPHPLDNPFIIETIRTSLQNSSIWKGNLEVPKADGTLISISLSVTKMKSDNDLNLYYVGAFSDISFEVRTKKAMETLESIDSLTGLTNRSFFKISHQEKISKAIDHSVIFIEIDNFKRVNDTLGFEVGDKILVNIAEMIKNTINKNDRCLVSRMGGDEFVVTIEGDNLAGRSSQLAEAIREKIIEGAGKEFGVTVAPSIGISLFPADAVTSDDLLKSADIAVYHAKSLGGNQVQFFKSNLNAESKKEIETEKLIRDSIKNEWFEVFYQPKINIRDKSISGMEALVRIRHPERGLVFPDEFIPLSEKLNLIGAIDDIVMKKACIQTKKWVDDGLFDGKLSLNMSAIQFKCPDIVESTMSKFNQYGLPSSYLEIEITETLAMDSIERTCDILSQFKSNGICISMDDFGTGYSSLSYLKDLPIDKLKIDRSFINNMSDDIKSKKLVSIIINMAHSFNLTVVAEGIETMDQLLTMELMNCDEAQGYFFSRPITSQMMEEMLFEKNKA
jgi:diguanylate cyclase (GGDEF)-like protein/PAS domain S-box-containing protein